MMTHRHRSLSLATVVLAVLLRATSGAAQTLEPGAYWPIPTGVNIVTLANSTSWGDVAFDPSLPFEDASATINVTAAAYTRAFGVRRRAVNVGVVVPVMGGHITGLQQGAPVGAERFGLGDPRVRVAMNLYGSGAMTPKELATYRLRTIVGVSVTAAPPLGQYDPAKLVNLGTNRWSFKPEVGVSHARGAWVFEAMAGVWTFTDNTDFFGGQTRSQEAITEIQAHLTYRFTRSRWLAADANYYRGGRTTIDGRRNVDFQRNSRVGATFSSAIDRRQAIRLSFSQGAYTTIGADFTSIGVAYNYVWAASRP